MSYQLPNFLRRSATDTATASAAVAVVTYAAATGGQQHALTSITATYSGTPTGGGLKVEDGTGTIIFQADITAAAPPLFSFQPPLAGSANTALIVTLLAGGAGIVGKLNCGHLVVGQ